MHNSHAGMFVRYFRSRFHVPETEPLTDGQLLGSFVAQQDEAAFEMLVHRHGPMVLQVARRVLHDWHAAEDVFQATFLVLARRAASICKRESVGSWLHGVAHRLAQKAKVDAARRHSHETQAAHRPPPDPAAQAAWQELQSKLDQEIERLPAGCRAAVVLCYLEGKTRDEAAQQLGWSLRTLHRRLERARELLRQRLTRQGLTLSAALLATTLSKTADAAAVPTALLAATIRAAATSTASQSGAGAVSAKAISLANGIPQTMAFAKLKIGAVLLMSLLIGGAGMLAYQTQTGNPQPAAPSPAAVVDEDKPQREAAPQVRTDRYGDPLPKGAVARLGTVRFRIPHEAHALALAPDGKIAAVFSYGGLFLFDAASGKRIRTLGNRLLLYNNSQWPENVLVFSPDSKHLATRGRARVKDGKKELPSKHVVRIWELDGKTKPREYDADHLIWIGWSAKGEPLAVCLEKEGVSLKELATGRSRCFKCPAIQEVRLSDYVLCRCAPAGRTLAVVDEQNAIHVWDTATGKKRFKVPAKKMHYLRSLAVSPDGRHLAILWQAQDSPNANTADIVDARTGRVLRKVATNCKSMTTLAFSPDSKTLATAGWRGIRCWDVATGRELSRSQGEGQNTLAVNFSGDGKTLATLQRHSPAFHFWDVATGKQKPEPTGHMGNPSSMAFSPDGKRMASGGSLDGTIHIWDMTTSKSLLSIHRGKWVRRIALSRDGRWLYSTWTDDQLWICDAATGKHRHTIKLEDPKRPGTYQDAMSLHLSADGKTLVALSYYYSKKGHSGPDDTLITGWDPVTRKQLFRRKLQGVDPTAVSTDARLLAVAFPSSRIDGLNISGKGPMRLEDLATGKLLLNFPKLEGQTWPLVFSPDGRLLASINYNRKAGSKIVLWEVATASKVLSLDGQSTVAFSPDGRLLAIAVPSQEILVWDLVHDRELRRFKGFDAAVASLAFTPDGRRLVSGLYDSTLLLWDVGAPKTPQKSRLSADSLKKAWTALAGKDAPRAFRARWALATAPKAALPLLRKHLKPVPRADARRVQQWIADLDSRKFAVRAKAERELEKLGGVAAPALRQTLKKRPTLEVSLRVEGLLQKLQGPVTRPDRLRAIRAVAILEDIGTPEARKLLTALAKGAPGARLTDEAKAAIKRLELRKVVNR